MFYGAHVSSAGGIFTAIDRAEAIGADAVQVFTQSPRAWRPTNHTDEACERFRARREEAGMGPVVCHASYLINLGATDDTTYARSVETLATTMEVGRRIGADGVVFHVGSHLGRGLEAALHQVIPALQVTLGRMEGDSPWLLIENSAGHEGVIGDTIEDLALIVEELGRPERVGLCLDTCHLFASGYDIRTFEGCDAVLDQVDERIGLDRLQCLHVNDSKLPFNSRRDRHENVGKGEIGRDLAVFLGHPRVQHLAAVVETTGADGHGPDRKEMQALKRLHKSGLKRWQTATASR